MAAGRSKKPAVRTEGQGLDGSAVVKNSYGDTTIGTVTGPVQVRAANGHIMVQRAAEAVDAKTANGSVKVHDVVRGSVVLETAMGDIEVGIHEGTAAMLLAVA